MPRRTRPPRSVPGFPELGIAPPRRSVGTLYACFFSSDPKPLF